MSVGGAQSNGRVDPGDQQEVVLRRVTDVYLGGG
jgi:hypothetical protein